MDSPFLFSLLRDRTSEPESKKPDIKASLGDFYQLPDELILEIITFAGHAPDPKRVTRKTSTLRRQMSQIGVLNRHWYHLSNQLRLVEGLSVGITYLTDPSFPRPCLSKIQEGICLLIDPLTSDLLKILESYYCQHVTTIMTTDRFNRTLHSLDRFPRLQNLVLGQKYNRTFPPLTRVKTLKTIVLGSRYKKSLEFLMTTTVENLVLNWNMPQFERLSNYSGITIPRLFFGFAATGHIYNEAIEADAWFKALGEVMREHDKDDVMRRARSVEYEPSFFAEKPMKEVLDGWKQYCHPAYPKYMGFLSVPNPVVESKTVPKPSLPMGGGGGGGGGSGGDSKVDK